MFTAARLLGATAFVMAYHDLGLHRLGLIVLFVLVGLAAQTTSWIGPNRFRDLAFEAALCADVAVLALAVHLTGGLSSPLQPIIAMWAVLSVIAHTSLGGLAWCSLMVAGVYGVGATTRILDIEQYETTDSTTLMISSLFALLAAATGAEFAARQIEAVRSDLETQATRDPLTGLGNRRQFDANLSRAVAAARRSGRVASLAIVDLDNFKQINDHNGHASGDEVLCRVAGALVRSTRLVDECYRIGGDEFAVLMPDCSPAAAELVIDRLRELLEETAPAGKDAKGAAAPAVPAAPAPAAAPAATTPGDVTPPKTP